MDLRRYASYTPLALAVLVAATLQAIIVARSPTVSADAILFISIARELPDGPSESFRRHDQHPGYPALLLAAARGVHALGYRAEPQSWVIAGQAVAYVCGLLSVVVVWLFARDLFDARVANLAAFIFAVLPIPRGSAADALSDTPHVLFYLLAAWLASSALIQGNWLRLAGAGLASGLAYWIRPEGLEVALIALACLVLHGFRAHWSWGRLGWSMAALAGTAFLVAAPYPILAGKITSKQLPFAKPQEAPPTFIAQLAAAPTPQPAASPPAAPQPTLVADLQPASATASTTTAQVAAADGHDSPPAPTKQVPASAPVESKPRYTVGLVLRLLTKALENFLVSMGQGFKFIFVPLYLVGHVELVRRKPEWMRIGFIALLGATHVAILLSVFILSGYIAHRHVIPLVGLAMPFTALGVIYVGEKLGRLTTAVTAYGPLVVLAACSAVILPYSLRPFNREFVPVIEATHWVERHAEPGSGIVSNSPYVDFYGRLPTTYLGTQALTVDDALARAPTPARYDYVVLHVNAHDYRPEWLTQLEPYYRQVQLFPDPYSSSRPKKVLVFQVKDGQARRVTRPAHS